MILFPEILGTREIVDAIIRKMQRAEIFELEKKNPMLIFMPSIWEDRYNECIVVTGQGEIKCIRSKRGTAKNYQAAQLCDNHQHQCVNTEVTIWTQQQFSRF